jgi:hypothetical protein
MVRLLRFAWLTSLVCALPYLNAISETTAALNVRRQAEGRMAPSSHALGEQTLPLSERSRDRETLVDPMAQHKNRAAVIQGLPVNLAASD